mmetsp:Transcript_83729/g.223991  ORF Transcript_83729/g.223991 Transcript_83729/m.223991 type:complete len:211 (-) Transcript_83729:1417-2049(-)
MGTTTPLVLVARLAEFSCRRRRTAVGIAPAAGGSWGSWVAERTAATSNCSTPGTEVSTSGSTFFRAGNTASTSATDSAVIWPVGASLISCSQTCRNRRDSANLTVTFSPVAPRISKQLWAGPRYLLSAPRSCEGSAFFWFTSSRANALNSVEECRKVTNPLSSVFPGVITSARPQVMEIARAMRRLASSGIHPFTGGPSPAEASHSSAFI